MSFISYFAINILNENNITFIYPGASLFLGSITAQSKYTRWLILASIAIGVSYTYLENLHIDNKHSIEILKSHIRPNTIVTCTNYSVRTLISSGCPSFLPIEPGSNALKNLMKQEPYLLKKPYHIWMYCDNAQNDQINPEILQCLQEITADGGIPKLLFKYNQNKYLYYISMPSRSCTANTN